MTSICGHIQVHERSVWNYLSDVFSFHLRASELGFTNDLVYQVAKYYRMKTKAVEVLAVHAKKESIRGADIDLFISNGVHFTHYMIQSKIMNDSGLYMDIAKHAPRSQFHKLINTAKSEGAFPLYLLFSGATKGSRSGNASSGCSVIDADKIRAYRWNQRKTIKTGKVPRISFDDVSSDSKPLHFLFCPGLVTRFKLPKGKTISDIDRGFPYMKVNLNTSIVGEQEIQYDYSAREIAAIAEERHLARYRIIIDDPDIYSSESGTFR